MQLRRLFSITSQSNLSFNAIDHSCPFAAIDQSLLLLGATFQGWSNAASRECASPLRVCLTVCQQESCLLPIPPSQWCHCWGPFDQGRFGLAVAFTDKRLAVSLLSDQNDHAARVPPSLPMATCKLPNDAVDPDSGQTVESLIQSFSSFCSSLCGCPSPPLRYCARWD